MSDLAQFTKLAVALEPWRSQFVFVGGWAYRLFMYDPRAYKPDYEAVFTQDADVAYGKREAFAGNIKAALKGAGFEEKDELVPIWKDLDATLRPNQRKSVHEGVKELFSGVNDTLREAAAIPSDRQPEPEDMLNLCQNGFDTLFG